VASRQIASVRWVGFLALPALTACLQVSRPADAGPPPCCSLDCVQTTLSCGLFPEGTPDFTCVALVGAGNLPDSGTAIGEFGAQACSSANEGGKVGCIAGKFPGAVCPLILADAGFAALQALIGAACPGGFIAGACDATCLSCRQTCGQTGITCNDACLAGGYYGCLACNAQCNTQQATCETGCTKS
jgi:hypothetical protein